MAVQIDSVHIGFPLAVRRADQHHLLHALRVLHGLEPPLRQGSSVRIDHRHHIKGAVPKQLRDIKPSQPPVGRSGASVCIDGIHQVSAGDIFARVVSAAAQQGGRPRSQPKQRQRPSFRRVSRILTADKAGICGAERVCVAHQLVVRIRRGRRNDHFFHDRTSKQAW